MSNNMKELLPSHIKEVDNTSKTWPSVIFWIIKDKGHGSLDSNILRQTKRPINRGSFLCFREMEKM